MLPTRTLAAAAKGGGDFMSLKQVNFGVVDTSFWYYLVMYILIL